MKNKKKFIILSSILVILAVGAFFIFYNLKKASTVPTEDTQDSNISYVTTTMDKPFYVELKANPSTGYQWQADFDTTLVKLNKADFAQNTNTNVVGAEVNQIFEFQILQKKDTTITFRYVRPWEVNGVASDTKTYKIIVK
jgi:predicted secreted protein